MKLWIIFTTLIICACNNGVKDVNESARQLYDKAKIAIESSGYPYDNSRNAQEEYRLIGSLSPSVVLDRRYRYFEELLYSGQNDRCIAAMEEHLELAFPSKKINPGNQKYFRLLALAYLRQGEIVNCVNHHSPLSCIIPLKGSGIHVEKEPAKRAFELYSALLQHDPKDVEASWLVNIAAMAADIPYESSRNYTLNLSVFRGDSSISYFDDLAVDLNIDVRGQAGGSSLEDFNNDGILDIFCSSYGLTDQVRLFIGGSNGRFEDVTTEFGLEGIFKALNFIHADYDNDGWVDILLLRGGWLQKYGHFPNLLLKNIEGEYFEDRTEEAGLLDFYPSQTADFGDVDLDGDLDLFVGNEYYGSVRIPSKLYINDGSGHFTEKSAEWGIELNRYVKAVVFDDFNNDRYPDLYISVYGNDNLLYINQSEGDSIRRFFNEESDIYGVRYPVVSFPAMSFDINNDGWQDLVVSSYDNTSVEQMLGSTLAEYRGAPEITEHMAVYLNTGQGSFSEQSETYGLNRNFLTMGCNYGDIDNDGWIDIYLGTGEFSLPVSVPNRMFKNDHGTIFTDVTTAGGFGQIQKGHGVSFGDVDRDGDQDIYHTVGGALQGDIYQNMFLENPGNSNNWIVLNLEGVRSNRKAIGAKVEIVLKGQQDTRRIYRTVDTGGSFGNNSLQLEIGLGQDISVVDTLKVIWPHRSFETSVFTHVEVDGRYVIREGSNQIEHVGYVPFSFSRDPKDTHEH